MILAAQTEEDSRVSKSKKQVSQVQLEGRFMGFFGKSNKPPKFLRLATAVGECKIKLLKPLRSPLQEALIPGDWVQVSVKQTVNLKKGKVKFQGNRVVLASPNQDKKVFHPASAPKTTQTKACVLVCQKSSCRKRGADQVGKAIAQTLEQQGLDSDVAIKGTGCMKQCKKGPCVVFMPDKSRYIGVKPHNIPPLIDKHFSTEVTASEAESMVER
ncbi:MAG: (2Fe-2S) ferredoxin domain-containing protein [Chroococcales cyanobacterium]